MQLATARRRLREYLNRAVMGPSLLVVDEIGDGSFTAFEFDLHWSSPGALASITCCAYPIDS